MGIKSYRPLTAGQRFKTGYTFEEITKKKPEKSLLVPLRKSGGRNSNGRITARFIGGGHKQMVRVVDFRRSDKNGISAKVHSIEYDPNRSARIALLHYADGEKRYIIAPNGLKINDVLMSGPGSEIKVGNCLPLSEIPPGTFVYNVEFRPGKGGQLARAAGSQVQLMARESDYAQLRLPSGEIRKVRVECYATIGQAGNLEHENISLGKAGRSRWLGRRPHNRGVSMNPIDHPNGGGEGKSKGGGGWHHPRSPWGVLSKGLKTRKKKKQSEKFIVKHRR
jgi:large subunit ribosomal protein L2